MSFYIYKHILNNEVVYVGKTTNMENRQKQHSRDKEWFVEDLKIEYSEVENKTVMDICELYYINKFKPKYNKIANRKDDVSKLNIQELTFKEFKLYNKIKDIKFNKYSCEDKNTKIIIQQYKQPKDEFIITKFVNGDLFKMYCELIYLSKNYKYIDFKDIKSLSPRISKKYIKYLEDMNVIKTTKFKSLFSIEFLIKDYYDTILKLEDDFYENLNIHCLDWSIYVFSYHYEILDNYINPHRMLFHSFNSFITELIHIDSKKYDFATDRLKKLYNYEVGENFKTTETYDKCNLYYNYYFDIDNYINKNLNYHDEACRINLEYDNYF